MRVRAGVRIAAVVALALAYGGVATASAVPAVWQDTPTVWRVTPGTGAVVSAAGASLESKTTFSYGNSVFDPRSATALPDGGILVADGNNCEVVEIGPEGTVRWRYNKSDDPGLTRPFSAQRLKDGTTLICDRTSFRVIVVNQAKQIVWQYGDGTSATSAGRLADPFSATRLANGNTLIVDNKGGCRVLEIRTSDYRAGAPQNGFTASSIVWRYGVDKNSSTAAGMLASPRSAERLSNGNTLIADEWGCRVIEVTPSGSIAWSYGTAGVVSTAANHLRSPCFAKRMTDGTTLIIDNDPAKGFTRILRVRSDKTIVADYNSGFAPGFGPFTEPRTLDLKPDGALLVANQAGHSIVAAGYVGSAQVVSGDVNMALPTRKRLVSLAWTAQTPKGCSVAMEYSIDGGKVWRPAAVSGAAVAGKPIVTAMRWRATLRGTGFDTPRLTAVQVTYDENLASGTTTGTGGTGGKGTGTGGTGGTGGSNGAHSSGTGTGSGSGSGTGSGSGAGTGSGSVSASASSGQPGGTLPARSLGMMAPTDAMLRGTVLESVGGASEGTGLGDGNGIAGGSGGSTAPPERGAALVVANMALIFCIGALWGRRKLAATALTA